MTTLDVISKDESPCIQLTEDNQVIYEQTFTGNHVEGFLSWYEKALIEPLFGSSIESWKNMYDNVYDEGHFGVCMSFDGHEVFMTCAQADSFAQKFRQKRR